MATQTLTLSASGTTAKLHDITNLHDSTYSLPRTTSIESITSSMRLNTKSSSDKATIVNLANLQCIHLRAGPPPSASKQSTPPPQSQFDSDSDSDSTSEDSSSSDADESSSYRTTPPLTRPCSPMGYDSDEDWDISKIKYTGGTELAPCFARESADEWADHIPGTPAIERQPFDWETITHRPSSSSTSPPKASPSMSMDLDRAETQSAFSDDDYCDNDDAGGDADEVWPDEMDEDDFPFLHTWPHSWIWHQSSDACTSSAVPSIHFHFVESLPTDQTSWTPLQDSRFGSQLTVPGHRAFNARAPPETTDDSDALIRGRESRIRTSRPEPCFPPFDGNTSWTYVPSLGRSVVRVMSLEEQAAMGVYSVASVPIPSHRRGRDRGARISPLPKSAPPECYERGRSVAKTPRPQMGMEDDELLRSLITIEEDEEEQCVDRGRLGSRRSA